jgi:hypothetical protein
MTGASVYLFRLLIKNRRFVGPSVRLFIGYRSIFSLARPGPDLKLATWFN